MEEWKRVVGYEGLYIISSYGRLMRCSCGNDLFVSYEIDKTGYARVKLTNGTGNIKSVALHRLVAEAFISNPEEKRTVNHKDGDKLNNSLSNIEWMTYSENHKHAYEELGRVRATTGKFGELHHNSKKIKGISGDSEIYFNSMMDAQRAGYNSGHISACCKGTRKTHKGYRWELVE